MKILLALLFIITAFLPSFIKAADEELLRKKAINSVLIFYNIGKMTPQDVNPGRNSATFLLLDQFILSKTEYNQIKVNFIRNGDSVWKYELQQNADKITFFMPKLQLPSPEQLVPQGMTFEVSMPERKQPFILTPQDLAAEHAKTSGRNVYRSDNEAPKDKSKDKDQEFLKSLAQWDDGFSESATLPDEQPKQNQDEFPLRIKAAHLQPLYVGAPQTMLNMHIFREALGPDITEIVVNTFVNGVPGKSYPISVPPPGQGQGARIAMDTSKISSPGQVTFKVELVCRSADGKEYRKEFSKNANAVNDENQYPKRGFKRSL